MFDNGFNSLGSSNIFNGLRYREWMYEVWESYKFYVQRMKEDSPDDPDATLCLEKDAAAASGAGRNKLGR